MPHKDPHEAVRLITGHTTLPFWPQLANLGPEEDMVLAGAWGLPCLEVDLGGRRVVARAKGREEALTRFYERLLAGDLDHFAPPHTRGLDALLAAVAKNQPPTQGLSPQMPVRPAAGEASATDPSTGRHQPVVAHLKGQVVGPVTFGTSVKDEAGRDIIHDRELMEACGQGLGLKAAWQARRLRQAGARAVVFFDEPSLSALGSAFMAVERETVAGLFSALFETVRSLEPALLGVHCCGNSDWPLLLASGADIISFDSWAYLDNFCLFPKEIGNFLARGGHLAWGAVPTSDPLPEDWSALQERLEGGLQSLTRAGVDGGLLRGRSLLTPSCGLGLLPEPSAERVLAALAWLRERLLAS
jgi:methionine synthase II (cobalamin-independent)